MIFPGRLVEAAIVVIEIEEVFEARMTPFVRQNPWL